jgi:hypothetical protein
MAVGQCHFFRGVYEMRFESLILAAGQNFGAGSNTGISAVAIACWKS